jgi:hypothetical protein
MESEHNIDKEIFLAVPRYYSSIGVNVTKLVISSPTVEGFSAQFV